MLLFALFSGRCRCKTNAPAGLLLSPATCANVRNVLHTPSATLLYSILGHCKVICIIIWTLLL